MSPLSWIVCTLLPATGWTAMLQRPSALELRSGWHSVPGEAAFEAGDCEFAFSELQSQPPAAPSLAHVLGLLRADAAAAPPLRRDAARLQAPLQVERLDDRRWRILRPGTELRDLRIRERARLPPSLELFDGNSLAGWHVVGEATFRAEQQTLLACTSTGKANSFLVSDRSFGDFLFELELCNELPGNSGVQIRSRVVGTPPPSAYVAGYQIEVDPSTRAWSGGLYEERGRGWLQSLEHDAVARGAFHPGQWNRYRIECVGPWIRAWVNDVPTADALDPESLEGVLALQVHAGQDTRVRFRGLRLIPFGQHAWRALDARSFVAEGAELSNDFGLRLTRSDDASLAGWTLHFRGEARAAHTSDSAHAPTPARGELLAIDEHSCSIPLDDERLAHPGNPRAWRELCVLAYADRVAVFRDHERVFESRATTGPDGPHVWLEHAAEPNPTQPFSRIESLEPAR